MMRLSILLICTPLLMLGACTQKDPIASDLMALSAAGRAVTAEVNLQNVMQRVQQSKTNADKATVMREAFTGMTKIQNQLQKIELKSPEVKEIQTRMVQAFNSGGEAALTAASALENANPAGLKEASEAMMATQRAIMTVDQDMSRLAKEHKVDLNKPL